MHTGADERRRELMAALTERLAKVRGGMTDAEFARLLADMVRTIERFAAIDARPTALLPDMHPDKTRLLIDLGPE